jgi:hypothetical protein
MSRTLRIIAAVAVLAIVPAGSSLAAGKLVKKSSGPLTATLAPPASKPKANKNIPIKVTATLKGKPAHATAIYEFLFAGTVVSTQNPYGKKPYRFTGSFKDNLVFPPSAVGQPLTFRVVVKAGGHTVNLDAPVDAQK